ncbi:hypothetical protein TREMEDRAFT_61651 [Tremella mesenterica DSM 1558]|uniref:uncharacterized protein n=1 Tax=Tremella mesenterica (strain ATCC 24925 / CBS 8224 / DSM 1558 / NBRC 9311 / NRRL Y-6157 / RJB 2259-6 / UBC 559-6) TaxID=578456 RepID=UPI0003F4A1A9|nr:uncharacterized protein TREMEDRAFT_61651 [Tremella mesenterica DSM 1558]EIW69880.1 hypothetical protein TREMEDRAFT_61651 [Tremella mesenterica DSM 1558]
MNPLTRPFRPPGRSSDSPNGARVPWPGQESPNAGPSSMPRGPPVRGFGMVPPTPVSPLETTSSLSLGATTPFSPVESPTSMRILHIVSSQLRSKEKSSLSAIQSQFSLLRSELTKMITDVETRILTRVDAVERRLNDMTQSKVEEREELRRSVTRIENDVEENFGALRDDIDKLMESVESLEEDATRREEKKPILHIRRNMVPVDQAKSVSAVIHRVVAFLYNTEERPFPSRPEDDEEWPTFEDSSELVLRFDFNQPPGHPHNTQAFAGVMKWIDQNTDQWPADYPDCVKAKEAPNYVFRDALKIYFNNLRRKWKMGDTEQEDSRFESGEFEDNLSEGGERREDRNIRNDVRTHMTEDVEEMNDEFNAGLTEIDPEDIASLANAMLASSSQRPSEPPVRLNPNLIGGLTKQALRRRRAAVAELVKVRRVRMPRYSSGVYEILDEPHSQMVEFGKEPLREWGNDTWISDIVRKILIEITSFALPTQSKNGDTSYRAGQKVGDVCVPHPLWQRGDPAKRLQQWQFSSSYLERYREAHVNDIVPTNVPLAFAEVRRMKWYLDHPERHTKGTHEESSNNSASHSSSSSLKRKRSESVNSQDQDDPLIGLEGLDNAPPRPISRSRSRSPQKRVNPLPAIPEESQQHEEDDFGGLYE